MIRVLVLLFLCGCVTTIPPSPLPADTAFDEDERDWLQVYLYEIETAVDNDDEEAYNFFMYEYLKERIRIWKLKRDENSSHN